MSRFPMSGTSQEIFPVAAAADQRSAAPEQGKALLLAAGGRCGAGEGAAALLLKLVV
jgi:hypothetical protein